MQVVKKEEVRRRFFGSENDEEPRLVDNQKKKIFFVVQNKHFPMASLSIIDDYTISKLSPTITDAKAYFVSISSDGIKTYGAMLSGKASYFTDSRHELVVKYSKSTLNTYIENKIQIPQSGDWTFQTGALEKGEYVFSVTQYLESQEKWVESTPVSLNINGNRRIIGRYPLYSRFRGSIFYL